MRAVTTICLTLIATCSVSCGGGKDDSEVQELAVGEEEELTITVTNENCFRAFPFPFNQVSFRVLTDDIFSGCSDFWFYNMKQGETRTKSVLERGKDGGFCVYRVQSEGSIKNFGSLSSPPAKFICSTAGAQLCACFESSELANL